MSTCTFVKDEVSLRFSVGGNSLAIPLPIIASSPHFLGADPTVRDAVEGLEPTDVDHRSYVDIEPITGSKTFEKKEIY